MAKFDFPDSYLILYKILTLASAIGKRKDIEGGKRRDRVEEKGGEKKIFLKNGLMYMISHGSKKHRDLQSWCR